MFGTTFVFITRVYKYICSPLLGNDIKYISCWIVKNLKKEKNLHENFGLLNEEPVVTLLEKFSFNFCVKIKVELGSEILYFALACG